MRIIVYVAIFVCLAGVSLLWKTIAGSGGSTSSGTSGQAGPAPSPVVDSAWAGQACRQASVLPRGFQLDAAFQTTAGIAATWEDGLSQGTVRSPLHDVAPGTTVAVCYVDGPWNPPPEVKAVYAQRGLVADRGIVMVVQNQTAPVQGPIAPHESLPIQRPTTPPRP